MAEARRQRRTGPRVVVVVAALSLFIVAAATVSSRREPAGSAHDGASPRTPDVVASSSPRDSRSTTVSPRVEPRAKSAVFPRVAAAETVEGEDGEDLELEPFQLEVLERPRNEQILVLEGDLKMVLAMCLEELESPPEQHAKTSVVFTFEPFRNEAKLVSAAFGPDNDHDNPEILECAMRFLHDEVLPAEVVDAGERGVVTVGVTGAPSVSSIVESRLPPPVGESL